MAEPNKTYSWKETFRLSARGYKMLHQMDKRILPLHALSHTVRALSPFLTVWLSAKVVGELAGARRPDVLWSLVALTVGVIALISLLKGALEAKQKSLWNTFFPRRDGMFCDKSLDMDYADLESIENRDLRSQIFQAEGWAGWGLNILLHCMTFIMVGVLGVLGAIALTFGLFTAKVPVGSLAWLNSPLVLLGVLLVLTLVTVMGPVCANKSKEYFARAAQESMFGNRLFTWLCCIGDDTTKAMDRRMYNQFEITEYYGQKDRTFSVSSPMARNSRGPAAPGPLQARPPPSPSPAASTCSSA